MATTQFGRVTFEKEEVDKIHSELGEVISFIESCRDSHDGCLGRDKYFDDNIRILRLLRDKI